VPGPGDLPVKISVEQVVHSAPGAAHGHRARCEETAES
jgi:hypothetical protein